MEFFCVYCKTRKKFDKYIKSNKIKNKYIVDIRKILNEEEVDFNKDKTYIKILIFNKIRQAIEKNKDIYYIPDFNNDFDVDKLLKIREIIGNNNFNVLVFYNEFRKSTDIINNALTNLDKFDNSQIIRDY